LQQPGATRECHRTGDTSRLPAGAVMARATRFRIAVRSRRHSGRRGPDVADANDSPRFYRSRFSRRSQELCCLHTCQRGRGHDRPRMPSLPDVFRIVDGVADRGVLRLAAPSGSDASNLGTAKGSNSFLAVAPAPLNAKRCALAIVIASFVAFCALFPFARLPFASDRRLHPDL